MMKPEIFRSKKILTNIYSEQLINLKKLRRLSFLLLKI